MSYDPNGPIAQQLMPLLVNELTSTYNIPADAQDTAEYMNILIGQRQPADEIAKQVKEVIDIPIDGQFVGRVLTEINRLEQLQASGQLPTQQQTPAYQQPQEMQQQQQQQLPTQQTQPFEFNSSAPTEEQKQPEAPATNPFPPAATVNPFAPASTTNPFPPAQIDTSVVQTESKFPSGPSKAQNNKGNQKGANDLRKNQRNNGKGVGKGVSKDFVSGKTKNQNKSFGIQNAGNLQKALAMVNPDTINMAQGGIGANDLMELVARSKPRPQAQPQVTLCKYGILCSKELCPFGHPTPANKDAKVHRANWCRQNKKCTNEDCVFAHSSPNYQAPPREPVAPPTYTPARAHNGPNVASGPTTLEQCKFGMYCTNPRCNKRHAMSQVPCKNGPECTRLDCSFSHILSDDCKFGNECKSKKCFYRHPDGRERAIFNGGGNARQFAVPEDQVMEQITQE